MLIPVNKKPHCLYYEKCFPFKMLDTSSDDIEFTERFKEVNDVIQEGFLFYYDKPVKILPVGWAITEEGNIIESSVMSHLESRIPQPDESATNQICQHQCATKLDLAFSFNLRYAGTNYWHLHNDLLGQIFVLHKWFPRNVPIIVSECLQRFPPFNFLIENNKYMKDLNFIFQKPNEIIECKKVIFAKTVPNRLPIFSQIVDNYDMDAINLNQTSENIFITRNPSRPRSIQNMGTIQPVLDKYEFECIDCADLTVEEQISYFRNAKNIIGLHGAGLANIMYSSSDCRLLELHSTKSIPPHYYWLAKQKGMYYNACGGSNPNRFEIDAVVLEAKINLMLENK